MVDVEWTSDVAAGDWVRQRLDDPWGGSMHSVVPRGFPAYARIFHPASVTWIPEGVVPRPDQLRELPWQELERLSSQFQHAPVTWQETAAAFDTQFHELAQWNAIVRVGENDPNGWQQTVATDGRQYDAPPEGELPTALVPILSHLLTEKTASPNDLFIAVWEGWGGLLGHLGENPSRAFLGWQDGAPLGHNDMLAHSRSDPFNNPYKKPTWQQGILPREISDGPRLELPGRGHVLFRGHGAEFADAEWVLTVPWRDREAESHGFPPSAHSPSLVWPADRTWIWVSEVDYDSTIVGGSRELIDAILASPALESREIPADADLTWTGDKVNR